MSGSTTQVGRLAARIIFILSLAFVPLVGQCGEGAMGWVYTLDLQPKGRWEYEQRVDLTHRQAAGTYDLGWYRSAIEYGVTNDFQAGVYLNAVSVKAQGNYISPEVCNASSCTAGFGVPSELNSTNARYSHQGIDGGSLELIYRLSNPVTSPVGVGLYLEPTWGKLEDSLEARLLVQSNFLDDRLILAANLLGELEREKYDPSSGIIRNSMADILWGVSYRFAPRWSAGIEGRFHKDHEGYHYNHHTQTARFIGPNLHYAAERWWTTVAWRHQTGGSCYSDGSADCSPGRVWDSHGRDQVIFKVGYLFD